MTDRWQDSTIRAMLGARRGVNLTGARQVGKSTIAEAEGRYSISHYRGNRKREIDFMVERKDGAVLGIEVKAGQASPDDFKHLKWFAANLAKERQFTGIVLYSGEHTLRFGEGFYAVPLAALGT